MCMNNRMAGSFIKRWKRYRLSCKGSQERVIYRARPYGMQAIHGDVLSFRLMPASTDSKADYRDGKVDHFVQPVSQGVVCKAGYRHG